jgi:flagellar basal body-associated protein FliL
VLNPQDSFKLSAPRRGLQRQHMNLLVAIALRQYDVPDDAQTVVRYEMRQLKEALTRALKKADPKDLYTLAHLEETRDRLVKAIDAPLVGN